jgi:hypothetical protein
VNRKLRKFGTDTNVATVKRLAAAVAAALHSLGVCSVKGIRFVRFLSNLLFIGFEIEIQGDGLRVEGKETNVTCVAGISTFNKKQVLYYSVHRNLLSGVCVRILTFCANCITDRYSTIQSMYIYQSTKQQFTPAQITLSSQSVAHLPLTLEDNWTYLLMCCIQQFTSECWKLLCCDAEG